MLVASRLLAVAESVLRGECVRARAALPCALLGGAVAGFGMGLPSGSWLLGLYSALKVPLLQLAATAVTLPSFYVLHCVLGVRDDFAAATRSLLVAQASLALALAALAPVCFVFAITTTDGYVVTLLHGAAFAAAAAVAQQCLARSHAPLIARNPRHRITLASWLVLYVFFAIQAAWVLRPFLGTPGFPVEFLRAEAFEQNAFVVVFEHVLRAFARR